MGDHSWKEIRQGLKPTSFYWLHRPDWSHALLQSDRESARSEFAGKVWSPAL